jgi:N-acetylmuramoyl-L-alanine amidase
LNQHYGLHLGGRAFRTLLATLAAVALSTPSLARSAQLDRIALQADRQTAVLTLSLSAPVVQHVFRLHNPDRLVIDLPGTRRRASLPQPPADAVVASVRSGVRAGHALRLVVELRSPMQPQLQAQARAHGYQLRIALAAAAPLAAAPEGAMQASSAAAPPAPETAPTATVTATAATAALTAEATAPTAGPTAATTTATTTVTTAATTAASAPPPASVPASASASASASAPAPAPAPKPVRSVRAAHAPQGEHNIIIAVDAGHGGDDPGATGVSGTHEKVVTLAIARALAARIDREPGMHAVLTRDGDYFVDLRNRMDRAHAAHADMFVSIHADAVRDRGVSGASVYILSERGASSEAAKKLAEHENAADLKGGISLSAQRPDVSAVLLDVAQSTNIGQSGELADRVLGALDRVGAVRKREVQQAAFVVLKSPDIPSMLIETAYISNAREERKLCEPAEQQRLAEAIFSGIDSYFRKFPPDGSQYARSHGEGTDSGVELARSGF